MNNQVDTVVDRTAGSQTLSMLEWTEQAVFHGGCKRVHDRSSTQSRPIANRTDIVILVGCGNVGRSNIVSIVGFVSIGRIQFRRRGMICISNGGNIVNHGRE